MTLIEVTAALLVFALGTSSAITSILASSRLGKVTDEQAVAREAIGTVLAELKTVEFDQVFALFNDDPGDNPLGVVDVPGSGFATSWLSPTNDDLDGFTGEIIFPTVNGMLTEEFADTRLGMPRDLNLDGEIAAGDRSGDYGILPLTIRVRWRGARGVQQIEQRYVLADLR